MELPDFVILDAVAHLVPEVSIHMEAFHQAFRRQLRLPSHLLRRDVLPDRLIEFDILIGLGILLSFLLNFPRRPRASLDPGGTMRHGEKGWKGE